MQQETKKKKSYETLVQRKNEKKEEEKEEEETACVCSRTFPKVLDIFIVFNSFSFFAVLFLIQFY